jgi:hypothetical protein
MSMNSSIKLTFVKSLYAMFIIILKTIVKIILYLMKSVKVLN